MQPKQPLISAIQPARSNLKLDTGIVHANTLHVNTILPLISCVRKLIEAKLPPPFRQPPVRRRQIEIQLVFPWHPKR